MTDYSDTPHENQQYVAKPWTPAPWVWRDPSTSDEAGMHWLSSDCIDSEGDGTPVLWSNVSMTTTQADAALIALAPEMAEAVMRYADWDEASDPFQHEFSNACQAIMDVAAKLRALTADQETTR